ncbi:unnamed protein product [Rotaria sp. Silwood2]|nr:unnamed protein product [Rotaria sp. Silwood2]CAF2903952.1 unnamed protein product [Rotaria sp. Silwood2]CAF3143399.1 unnamed protein product [Rotaria sp. Silwood2]CAF3289664.1 unnamed protein product [Rotaria sp. Silwood2]CAF3980674.1 unnamed protein product [Rotaria sp. Silwood2]
MPSSTSSNITTAKRIRRSNKQHRRRHELSHVIRYPTFTNVFYYAKYFFFKTALGRLMLIFTLIAGFNLYFFSEVYWPKILTWLQNSTSKSIDTSFESSTENDF